MTKHSIFRTTEQNLNRDLDRAARAGWEVFNVTYAQVAPNVAPYLCVCRRNVPTESEANIKGSEEFIDTPTEPPQ